MSRELKIIRFYVLCNHLKDVIRTGWKDWHVQRERVESVAEHIYGVQMLALAMYSEFEYAIDIRKVIMMLAVHELEEIIIGDLTQFQISKEEKQKLGHDAVNKLLKGMAKEEEIKELVFEFDERKTPEAFFAYQCDKLECDIQSKLYDEECCVDLNHQEGNTTFQKEKVQQLLQSEKSFSRMWIQFGQDTYPYDEHFMAVSNYAKENNLHELSV